MAGAMTPGQLYDELHKMFGIGDYDDLVADSKPFHAARMTEIAKLKGMLKRRHCTVEEVHLAARYAQAQGKPISAAWQLFVLVPEALKYQRDQQRAERVERDARGLAVAIDEAIEAGEHEWAERLMRTPPNHPRAGSVLEEWRNR